MPDTDHPTDIPALHADAWGLDPAIAMLNHGSFGACPRAVLETQERLRAELERQPVLFFERRMQPLLDDARQALAELIGADPLDVVFVNNATAGVNAVLRSLRWQPGDELLVTDHSYNACRNVAEYVAGRTGARVVVAAVPSPLESPEQVVEVLMSRVTQRTRLAILDHITSPTAVTFPVAEIVRQLDGRGVDTLIDGAHAPGVIPLDVQQIGAAYYTGNCHKWLCAPKGAGFLHVRPDRQEAIHPPVISHGFNTPRPGRTRFHTAFDWAGTDDPTAWLCVGEAIRFLEGLLPGGLEALMRRNRELAAAGRRLLCEALHLRATCPEEMIGSMAAVHLADDCCGSPAGKALVGFFHPLHDELLGRFGIEVPVYHWPAAPRKVLRISAQAYNSLVQYERLVTALEEVL